MKGTWQTTDTGGGCLGLLIIVGVILIASGAAAETAAAVVAGLIVIASLAVLIAGAVVAWLVYRAWRSGRGVIPAPVKYELPAPERPAIASPAARELHLHLHELTLEQIAALLRVIPPGSRSAD
jgi:hypothetical protein